MQETKKTLIIAGVALLLGVVAFASAPRRALPDLFFDVGETFFPEFADPTRRPRSTWSNSTQRPLRRCHSR